MKNSISFFTLLLIALFMLFSCGSDDMSPEEAMPMEETLEGDYIGSWSSTTTSGAVFTNYAISAKLSFSNSDKTGLRGEFFATSSFVSCCNSASGANDGSISIDFTDNIITSFNYSDTIIDCTGAFIGTGTINDFGQITINFTGSDCDGEHVGTMTFRKKI